MGKKAKRVIILFMFIVLFLSAKTDARAASSGWENGIPIDEQDILATSDDFEAVHELDQEILNDVQKFCLSRELKTYPEEVDYKRAVRLYTGVDLIQMDDCGKDEMLKELKSSEYEWIISFKTAAGSYQIAIAGREPYTEDGEEQRKAREWTIKSHSLIEAEPYMDQIEKKEAELTDCTRIVFAEGQTGFHKPVAVGFDHAEAKYLIGLGFRYEAAAGNTSNTSVYEYDKIAVRAREMYATDSTEVQWGPLSSGGGSLLPAAERTESAQIDESKEPQTWEFHWKWIAIPVLAAAVVTGAVVLGKRKSR